MAAPGPHVSHTHQHDYGPPQAGARESPVVCTFRGRTTQNRWSAAVRILVHHCHDASPAGAAALELDREAGHLEAVGAGELVQVGQLLDLAVLALDADPMRRPDDRWVAGLLESLLHGPERPIQRPGVGADDLDPAVAEPERRFPTEAAAGLEVLLPTP